MKSFVRRLVFSLVLLLQTIGLAQAATTYPVQLNAQVLPPYTNCIGDYVNTSSTGLSRIQVSCLLRDLQHPSYNVGIRMMVVQGSQVKMKTMTQHNERVENNVLHRFNVSDLFQANNVWGKYDADGYCLKEGGYEFVFQAFDGGDERLPLSEPVRVFVYLSQAEPPRPVSPANGECVNYQSSFINFVWMESQVASFNANRKYRIEVYEVPENSENYDQQALINSNATKFTIEDINGMVNFYAMQNTAGRLVKGRTYLWRVQVYDKTTQLTDGKNIYSTSSQYENGGYSEVYSFKFANCQPFEIKTDSIDSSKKPVITKMDTTGSKATVHWLNEPDKYPCGYIVAFNKAEDTLSNWGKVEMGVNDSVYTFKNIEQGVEYVTHIIGIVQCDSVKGKIYSANSADSTFMLPKAPEKDCHNNIDPLTSKASADTLTKGSYFTANDRDIKITEITRSINAAGDTLYTGYGISYCPLLEGKLGIKVKFDSVKINANHELMQGRVYAPSDAANAASLDASGIINEGYTGTGAAPVQTSAYPTYKDTSEIPEGSIGNVNGVLYVKKDGVVTKLGTVEKVTDLKCDIDPTGIDDKVGVVTFTPNGYMNPPYDKNKSPFTDADIEEYYANYKVGTGRYDVPWFAMVEGDSAIIKADFSNNNNEVPDTAITFVCVTDTQAVILESEYLGNHKFSMFIYGGEAQKSLNIYAIYSNNNGDCKTLGRARVLTMPKQKQELILVPVRRAQSTVDSVTIEKQLNSIYQPLGVTYKVHVDEQFGGSHGDGDETYGFLDEGLAVTGSGLFTTETDDMKTLKALYAQDHSIKDSVAYIFILPKATTQDGSSIAVLGDMPRNHQVGYVFSEPTTPYADGLTIAHELGHGLYSFEHTFENNGPTQGSTSNLMDYSNNAQKDLRVWQWNLIYSHKTYTVPFFEADEDGMYQIDGKNRLRFANVITKDQAIIDNYKLFEDLYKVFCVRDGKQVEVGYPLINDYKNSLYNKEGLWLEIREQFRYNYDLIVEGKEDKYTRIVYDGKKEYIGIYSLNGIKYFFIPLVDNPEFYNYGIETFYSRKNDGSSLYGNKNVYLARTDDNDAQYMVFSFHNNERATLLLMIYDPKVEGLNNSNNKDKYWASILSSWSEKLLIKTKSKKTNDTTEQNKKTSNSNQNSVSLVDNEELPNVKSVTFNAKSIQEGAEKAAEMIKQAKIKAKKSIGSPGCNQCVRTAFYNITGSYLLYPKKGSDIDDNKNHKGVITDPGTATDMYNDFINGNMNKYFEKISQNKGESIQNYVNSN